MRTASVVLSVGLCVPAVAQLAGGGRPDRAGLEGTVLTQAGEPIPRASLRLESVPPSPPRTLATIGDDTGKFILQNIPPGPYTLSANKNGFLEGHYGQRTLSGPGLVVTLDAGKTMTNASIRLTAQSVISGQVIDQDGDPVELAQVGLLRNTYISRRWRLSATGARAQTDERGSFRISGLNPGRYYLSARPSTEGVVPRGYVTTFYPNTINASTAVPIDIPAASESKGMDVRIHRETAFSVRGTASGPAVAGARLIVNRLDAEGLDQSEAPVFVNVVPDGRFELHDLRPGSYVVQIAPNQANPAQTALSGRVEFKVMDSDVDGVRLVLGPSVQISAIVRLEGGNLQDLQAQTTHRIGVQLQALDPGVGASELTGNANGTIPAKPVAAGKYLWDAYALPTGTYVKSAHYGIEDVTRTPLDVVVGPRLEILLALNAASVSGVVQNAQGDLVSGIPVTLWPKVPNPGGLTAGIKMVTTDPNGGFRIDGLAPGEYFTAAWEEIESSVAQYPDFLARFTSSAALVKLGEGSQEAVSLKLISSEEAARELANLP